MQVFFTEMAERCLNEIESFALEHHPQKEAAEFVDGLLVRNHDAIAKQPELYKYNRTLLDFGLKIRERLDNSYRCLYEIRDDTVYVLLFLHTKQDLIASLYRHQIVRNT